MLFHSSDAQTFTIPGGTSGLLYPPSPKGDQSVAVVELDGIYPEKGWSVNDICTETLYVLEGELKLIVQKEPDPRVPRLREDGNDKEEEYALVSGDLFMILPGNKYRLSGKGTSCVFITPSWDSSQNNIFEE